MVSRISSPLADKGSSHSSTGEVYCCSSPSYSDISEVMSSQSSSAASIEDSGSEGSGYGGSGSEYLSNSQSSQISLTAYESQKSMTVTDEDSSLNSGIVPSTILEGQESDETTTLQPRKLTLKMAEEMSLSCTDSSTSGPTTQARDAKKPVIVIVPSTMTISDEQTLSSTLPAESVGGAQVDASVAVVSGATAYQNLLNRRKRLIQALNKELKGTIPAHAKSSDLRDRQNRIDEIRLELSTGRHNIQEKVIVITTTDSISNGHRYEVPLIPLLETSIIAQERFKAVTNVASLRDRAFLHLGGVRNGTFDLFLNWLFSKPGIFLRSEGPVPNASVREETLIDLYHLGMELKCVDLIRSVIDAVVDKFEAQGWFIPAAAVDRFYSETPKHLPIQALMVDLFMRCREKNGDMVIEINNLPPSSGLYCDFTKKVMRGWLDAQDEEVIGSGKLSLADLKTKVKYMWEMRTAWQPEARDRTIRHEGSYDVSMDEPANILLKRCTEAQKESREDTAEAELVKCRPCKGRGKRGNGKCTQCKGTGSVKIDVGQSSKPAANEKLQRLPNLACPLPKAPRRTRRFQTYLKSILTRTVTGKTRRSKLNRTVNLSVRPFDIQVSSALFLRFFFFFFFFCDLSANSWSK